MVSKKQQSFATLPLKPNGQKNMGAHDRIAPDSAISKHETPNRIHRWSLPELDTPAKSIMAGIKWIFILVQGEP
jgi:hypothetical protein